MIYEHPKSTQVQRWGCEALRALCLNGEAKTIVVQDGGIETILGSMIECEGSVEVLRSGCMALAVLASTADVTNRIVDENGVGCILQMIHNSMSEPAVLEAAAQAFYHLSWV